MATKITNMTSGSPIVKKAPIGVRQNRRFSARTERTSSCRSRRNGTAGRVRGGAGVAHGPIMAPRQAHDDQGIYALDVADLPDPSDLPANDTTSSSPPTGSPCDSMATAAGR